MKLENPFTSLVQKPQQMTFLWALCYPSGAQHTDLCELHLTGNAQHTTWLPGGGFPFDLHTLTYLSLSYPDATTKIFGFPFKIWTYSFQTLVSFPWEALRLVYRYLKKCVIVRETISKQDECDSISIYLSILYFTHGTHIQIWTTAIIINKCLTPMWLPGPSKHLGGMSPEALTHPWSKGHHSWWTRCTALYPGMLCLPIVEVNRTSIGRALHTAWPQGGEPAWLTPSHSRMKHSSLFLPSPWISPMVYV